VTGAAGFLGWHLRCRLRALTGHDVLTVDREQWSAVDAEAGGIDAIIHVAGINRGSDAEVEQGNIELARDVVRVARESGSAPRIVFANSIRAGEDSPYGVGKGIASDLLEEAAAGLGSAYVDVRLPNLFGEHGRPRYNSFVASFVDAILRGEKPQIADRPVALLHAQSAVQVLIDGLETDEKRLEPAGTRTTVQDVFDALCRFHVLYAAGGIPPLLTSMDVDLFNTLRSAGFVRGGPISLAPRVDDRGSLVEVARSHGGPGQSFVSTTRPGITRGEHFHLRKIERFVVVDGSARISLRRLFTDEVVSFDVTGEAAVAVDMPTMWAHKITNTGASDLTTVFWANELFDPAAPDTFPEAVDPADPGSRASA
jgi:UDP-2-acetamido-2,6-beta-L-arabino-hexul-4-ose reductase